MRITKKPSFGRQHIKNVNRLKKSGWRNPRGRTNKLRLRNISRGFLPHPGYGTPKRLWGLHPSMIREVMVCNAEGLELIDKSKFALRVSSTVGNKKRIEIQNKAANLGLRVLNPKKIEPKKHKEKPKEQPKEQPKEHQKKEEKK